MNYQRQSPGDQVKRLARQRRAARIAAFDLDVRQAALGNHCAGQCDRLFAALDTGDAP